MGSDTLKYVPPTRNVGVGQVCESSRGWVIESKSSTGDAELSYLECVGR